MPTMTSARINEEKVNDTENQQQGINIHRHFLTDSVLRHSLMTDWTGYKQKCLVASPNNKRH